MAGMVMTLLVVAKSSAMREWSVFYSNGYVIDGWFVLGLVKGGGCDRGKVLAAAKDIAAATRLLDGKRHEKGLLLWGCCGRVGGYRLGK